MNIRTRYSLITAALIGAVVASMAVVTQRSQRAALQAQSLARQNGLQDGVLRLAQESLEQRDPLMLLSYLMYVQRSRPEVVYAAVARAGHTSTVGVEAQGLVYWSQRVAEPAPVRYTITSSRSTPEELSVSTAGVSLSVHAPSRVLVEQGRLPEGMTITLGYAKDRLDADIDAALRPLTRRTLGIAAVFMLLGWAGAATAAKLLTGPLTALTAAVGSVGRGRLDVEVPHTGSDEVGVLGTRFNEMTGRVRALLQFREDVLHTLTHELNTPLGGLKGYLELWQERGVPEDPARRRDALATMGAAVLRMENSLQNGLKLFRDEAELPGELKLIWLDDVLREVVVLFEPTARAKRIRVCVPTSEVVDCVYADEELVRRIATNLVSNALKYTREGGAVTIALDALGDVARFKVSDTGVGMKPEDLSQIFTKFYRAGQASGNIPGSGLGLMIAQRAAQSLGGKISVESVVGKGSTFTVELPRNLPKSKTSQELK